MPEYLAPGVYVEETGANVTPIPGVTTSIDDETARRLVAAVEPIVRRFLPDWTGFNDSDPGVTLVQLFAFLAENVLYRLAPEERRRFEDVVRAVANVVERCATVRATPKRPLFFDGRFIDAAALRREQQYIIDTHRRHNLNVHGFGVVSGLGVSVGATDDGGDALFIEPGYAIDRCGDEIAVASRVRVPLPADGKDTFVSVSRWEHPCATPSSGSLASEGDYVEDACLIAVNANVSRCALPIARLARTDGRWTVDTSFVAPRCGSR